MARPKEGYRLADGTRVPGTTTITGRFKDSGGLLYWACEQGKAIERGEISQLYDRRDEAADAGTLTHALFERHLKQLTDMPPEWGRANEEVRRQAERGFENARQWLEMTGMEVESFENPLVSERYKFGGTPDAIIRDHNGHSYLGDWKTGGLYVDVLIQLAAYRQLLRECLKMSIAGAHAVRFPREGGGFTHKFIDNDTLDIGWQQFESFLAAYVRDKELKKRAK